MLGVSACAVIKFLSECRCEYRKDEPLEPPQGNDTVTLAPQHAKGLPLQADRLAQFSIPRMDGGVQRELALSAIPRGATIAGMFDQTLARAAAEVGRPLPGARARYTAFSFYPLHEHLALLFEACDQLYPGVPERRALRKLGRAAVDALLASTVGRVLLASATDPLTALEAFCKAYAVNMKPGQAWVAEHGPGWAVVRLDQVHLLLDCHQPGAFEGLMGHLFEVRIPVQVHLLAPGSAEYLVRW